MMVEIIAVLCCVSVQKGNTFVDSALCSPKSRFFLFAKPFKKSKK